MGHERCGTVKSAVDEVEMGHITAVLENINPEIEKRDNFSEDKRTVENEKNVNAVIKNNVLHTIDEIKRNSPIIAEMAKNW